MYLKTLKCLYQCINIFFRVKLSDSNSNRTMIWLVAKVIVDIWSAVVSCANGDVIFVIQDGANFVRLIPFYYKRNDSKGFISIKRAHKRSVETEDG